MRLSRQKLVGWILIVVSVAYIAYFLRVRLFTPGPILERKEWVQFIGSFVILMLVWARLRRTGTGPWAAILASMAYCGGFALTSYLLSYMPLGAALVLAFAAAAALQGMADLKGQGRAALVTFLTAGDPDFETSVAILRALPAAGADLVELGMPFTDPMADGPAIQLSSQRALKAGQTMSKTLEVARAFRQSDAATPLVLMGYYNPIYIYGVDRFLRDAKSAGVDGLIVVDLPPEEDEELCLPALKAGVNFIRLATPTTDDKRLPAVLANTSGFVYYVSITGITGTAMPDPANVAAAVARIKRHTSLPVAVGFGVRTAEQACVIASCADGVVVGSALVNALKASLDPDDKPTAKTVTVVINLVAELARGVRSARRQAAE